MKNIKAYIPNAITMFRFVCNAVFISSYLSGNMFVAIASFVVGAASDALDGHLARKWQVQSKFGKYADPIADKLLGISGLILLTLTLNKLFLIPGILEGIIALVNGIRFSNKKDNEVGISGKVKTPMLFSTITFGLFNVIFPQLTPLLIPLITSTIVLQLSTIKEYVGKSIEENKKEVVHVQAVEQKKEIIKKKELKPKLRKTIDKYKDLRAALLNTKSSNSHSASKSKILKHKMGTKK